MLTVTVELWPGGRESGRRVLATADIARIKSGAHADYEVDLREAAARGRARHCDRARISTVVGERVGPCGQMHRRCAQRRPRRVCSPRPLLPEVPVHDSDGLRYVRMREIPGTRADVLPKEYGVLHTPVN